jgi:zinc protease
MATAPISRAWGAGVALVLTLTVVETSSEAAVFNPETFTLENGMQVVVVTNRRAPVVSHHVWYKVGSADSPPGKSGLAHFLEHLMFKGTSHLESGEFSRIVARNGGNENAFTGPDYTGYFQTIAKDRLETVMRMEADRMTNLRLEPSEVLTERDVVLEERSLRVDNDPGARLGELVNATQYLNHPYRLPVIGWRHEMASYTREDALAFYRTWYAPNNAVLIVAGDIDAAELRPLAEKYYGVIPARPVPERHRLGEPPQDAPREVDLADPRVQQPSLIRSYLAPSFDAGASEHAYPLEVLAEILGGTSTSRLYRALVIDQKLATSAGAFYRGTALDLTTFRVYASPRPGVGLDELEAALDAELERLRSEPITAADVGRATSRMIAEAVYARDSLSSAVRSFGAALATGGTVEDVEAWPERIGAVTPDQVNAAAAYVLDKERSVTGTLSPAPLATAAVEPAAGPPAPALDEREINAGGQGSDG